MVSTVHPHAGGEYGKSGITRYGMDGSPPRRWGIPSGGMVANCLYRFTPTQVGNTGARRTEWPLLTVHPHAGGEYALAAGQDKLLRGSPPRRWGIRQHHRLSVQLHRFTPTQVGNTNVAPGGQYLFPVHPHAGGEYIWMPRHKDNDRGSPPRRWGIHFESRSFEAIEQASSMDHGCLVINFNPSHSVTILSAAPQNSIPKPCSQCLL